MESYSWHMLNENEIAVFLSSSRKLIILLVFSKNLKEVFIERRVNYNIIINLLIYLQLPE